MPVQLMQASPNVRQTLGRVALQRGPLVYCLEGVDNDIAPLDRVAISLNTPFKVTHKPNLLGGVVVVQGKATVLEANADPSLYTPARPIKQKPVQIMAVPYCTWDNRNPGEMRVWLRRA